MRFFCIIFVFTFLLSTNAFSEAFKIHCYPDTTLENNMAGGNFTLLISEDPLYVYKTFDNSYVFDFIVFNKASIIFELPSGSWALIDRISGHYKIINTPTDAFSNSVWKCEKIDSTS